VWESITFRVDYGDNSIYIVVILVQGGDTVEVKQWTIRVPLDLLEWVRVKAAEETIRHKKMVSMNAVFLEILTKAMKADKKKGG
jgi:hypothetical protein